MGYTNKEENISARVVLNPYSNKILSVLKAKYGLRDKSEAINKFVEIYGDEIVEKEASEEYTKKIIEEVNEHLKKYRGRRMTSEELDALFEVNV